MQARLICGPKAPARRVLATGARYILIGRKRSPRWLALRQDGPRAARRAARRRAFSSPSCGEAPARAVLLGPRTGDTLSTAPGSSGRCSTPRPPVAPLAGRNASAGLRSPTARRCGALPRASPGGRHSGLHRPPPCGSSVRLAAGCFRCLFRLSDSTAPRRGIEVFLGVAGVAGRRGPPGAGGCEQPLGVSSCIAGPIWLRMRLLPGAWGRCRRPRGRLQTRHRKGGRLKGAAPGAQHAELGAPPPLPMVARRWSQKLFPSMPMMTAAPCHRETQAALFLALPRQ